MEESEMTKLTITVDYSLAELKQAMRNFDGTKGKIKKSDIASWLGSLAEADVMDYVGKQETDDEEYIRLAEK